MDEDKILQLQIESDEVDQDYDESLPALMDENGDMWSLSPWAILMTVLEDYGIDTSDITLKIGEHLVEDFMEGMECHGYVRHQND